MTELLQLLVLGMATGGFYTINALGLVVVFRSSGIINFAGGGTAMVGGYVAWQLGDQWGWPLVTAVAGAVAAAGLMGLVVYLTVIRPLAGAAALTKVIATLAALVSVQQAVILIFGGLPKVPASFLPSGSAHLGPLQVGVDSLILLAAACGLTFALEAAYRWTRFGLATSALAEAPRSLAALGWNISRLRAANWAIGGALAGLAGAALGPILQLTPGTFTALLIPTLACAMIGGLKSFPMTLAGGLLVGAAQAVASRYVTWTGAGEAVPFLLIILVLVVRGRSLPLRSFVQERLPRVGTGELRPVPIAVALVAAIVFAFVVRDDWVIGATVTIMTATVLLSQVVITGYAGQLSLAQLTLGGIGAIAAANVAAAYDAPFLVSLAVGMLAVIPVSVLVGLPSLRARGVSLAIATLGLAVAIYAVVLSNTAFAGGLSGLMIAPQSLFGWSINSTLHPRRYYFVVLTVFAVLAIAITNVRRGRSGRRLLAVRNNERAAKALGIDVVGTKLYAFTLAGVIAAAGGVLMVFNQALPQFSGFDPLVGLNILMGAVLGGIGFIPGALVGGMFNHSGLPNAILYPLVGTSTWWAQFFPLVTGVALVLQLVVNPDGIAAGLPRSAKQQRRRTEEAQRSRARDTKELESVDASATPTGGKSLVARNLRVVFGSVVALDGVDLEVSPGEVLAVIGPNGAGKTTLLDAITGFVQATGTVQLADRPIHKLSAHRRAREGLARSFQSLELFEDMTVMDNLRCAADPQDRMSLLLDLCHPARGSLTPATATAVEAFGLSPHLGRLPTEIGYGDRRLVAIARALAGAPAALLLDEPAAGLSEFERDEVARLITTVAREWQIAIVLIEHDVELVRQVSDRVVALDFGRVIATGTPDHVLSHPDVVQAYLGIDEQAQDETPPATTTPGSDSDRVASLPQGSTSSGTSTAVQEDVYNR